jgi:hypothetical protein
MSVGVRFGFLGDVLERFCQFLVLDLLLLRRGSSRSGKLLIMTVLEAIPDHARSRFWSIPSKATLLTGLSSWIWRLILALVDLVGAGLVIIGGTAQFGYRRVELGRALL